MFGSFFNMDRFFRAGFGWENWQPASTEELRKTGNVVEETEEKDDIIIKRLRYTGKDGTTLYREESYPKGYERFSKLQELRENKRQALLEERYEDAARYRDEMNSLRKELKAQDSKKKLNTNKQV